MNSGSVDACHTRATPSDPLPDWIAALDAQVVERLAAANLAAVELAVEPADAHAKLTSSSFTPDETFAPRTIHLPPGHHVFVVKSPGFDDAQQAIDVTDKTAKRVVIALHRSATPVTHVDGPPPSKDKCVDALNELVVASRKESGSARFEVFQQASRLNHFTLVEVWQSETDYLAHLVAAHTKRFREVLTPMSGALYDERRHNAM